MSATYGEFINAVEEVAQKFEYDQALVFLKEWFVQGGSEEDRGIGLAKIHVIKLAEFIACRFREIVVYIESDEPYSQTVCAGHDFLADIHQAAVKLNLDIDVSEVDMPLTELEQKVMVRIGSCPRPENN